MSQVSPHELNVNKGRGLYLIGTVCCKEMKKINMKDVGEFHLVCGETLHENFSCQVGAPKQTTSIEIPTSHKLPKEMSSHMKLTSFQ